MKKNKSNEFHIKHYEEDYDWEKEKKRRMAFKRRIDIIFILHLASILLMGVGFFVLMFYLKAEGKRRGEQAYWEGYNSAVTESAQTEFADAGEK